MTRFRHLVGLVATVLTIGHPGSGAAAPGSPPKETRKASSGKAKILKLEEMKVEGKIQKPQAMFLMPRANLNVGELDHAEPLLPRITQAAEKDPL